MSRADHPIEQYDYTVIIIIIIIIDIVSCSNNTYQFSSVTVFLFI